jgi:hypothetical protein
MKFTSSSVPQILFLCFGQKKLTLESLADSMDELNNADRNAVY